MPSQPPRPARKNPLDNLSDEERVEVARAVGQKFEQDIAKGIGVASRVTKALLKLWIQPKVHTVKTIIDAINDDKK